jgi:hypothetical protein
MQQSHIAELKDEAVGPEAEACWVSGLGFVRCCSGLTRRGLHAFGGLGVAGAERSDCFCMCGGNGGMRELERANT